MLCPIAEQWILQWLAHLSHMDEGYILCLVNLV